MKAIKIPIFILLLSGFASLYSQPVKTSSGKFLLNNIPDTEAIDTVPPVIKLVAPAVGGGQIFMTEDDHIDIIGEVTDASKIRFVSVNKEVLLVNETGVFLTSMPALSGQIRVLYSMNRDRISITGNHGTWDTIRHPGEKEVPLQKKIPL